MVLRVELNYCQVSADLRCPAMDERIVDIETSLQVLATDKREEHHSPIATSHSDPKDHLGRI